MDKILFKPWQAVVMVVFFYYCLFRLGWWIIAPFIK